MEGLKALTEADMPLHVAVAFRHVSHGSTVHASTQQVLHESLIDCMLASEETLKPQAQVLLDQLTELAASAQKVLSAVDAAL